MGTQLIHYKPLCLAADLTILVNAIKQTGSPDIGGHNQNRVFKINRPSLGIRDSSVVEHLQKHIEHIRMGLFNLVKKHHRVRLSPDRFRELSALLITHISGRRSNQP